jgi:leucyl-tRNA synthetase
MNPYDHKKIEKKWQEIWEQNQTYKTDESSDKPKQYVLDMFPYPSGEGLHVGHPRGYIASDVYSRMKRMSGFNVLHPMGWDAFGLPAENFAIKHKIHPRIAVEKNIARFKEQLSILGPDYDWSREINTSDPNFYRWTQWIFLQMYKKGLAYESYEPINWCPGCQTGLANEDIEADGTCERCGSVIEKKPMRQWVLRITDYADRMLADLEKLPKWPEGVKEAQRHWIGKSEGSEISFPISFKNKITRKILIGTRNDAKFRMTKECLPVIEGIEYISLNDIPPVDDSSLVEGMDSLENAKMKAEFYFKKTGFSTISTDNVFWLEKWHKDNGVMVHMRKEANPDSDRATDEETLAFLKSWVNSVGGQSKAHFIYAVAFASPMGTDSFISTQRDYVLQDKQSQNFWPGYPTEALLIDVQTNEYKGDQDNSVRYDTLIKDLKNYAEKWFNQQPAIKIFTTRADTLYGATYMVLAPEHPWVTLAVDGRHRDVLNNKDEVIAYIEQTKQKNEIERTGLGKEKTGVELLGVKAINPATGEEIPMFIADYVLPNYGTGAIMAVPAHDERDFEFAQKYGLLIRKVIAPETGLRRENEEFKDGGAGVVFDPVAQKYAFADLGNGKQLLFAGGVNDGEDVKAGILREVTEESGLHNFKYTEWIETGYAHYFNQLKKVNRFARAEGMLVILENTDTLPVALEAHEKFSLVWKDAAEVKSWWQAHNEENGFDHYLRFLDESVARAIELGYDTTSDPNEFKKTPMTKYGILEQSEKFDGLTSEEAIVKITESVGGVMTKKYKLKDWVFSRQRYWGEPIPIIHCTKCGIVPVPEDQLPVMLPEVSNYAPTGTGESPLALISEWVNVPCPTCGESAQRETNTMPQWAGSSWYYLRYVDPNNGNALIDPQKEKDIMPVDVYVGADHATRHLIYARFWHKFLFDIGVVTTEEPFPRLEFLGYILAEDGRKMSKRWGNVINPDDMVDRFGADAFRLYEMFIGPFESTAPWNMNGMVGTLRFVERVWRLQGIVTSNETSHEMQKILHKTIKKVENDIEQFKFNTAVSSMMIFANELEKAGNIHTDDWKKFLRILAPFAPHATEEMWQTLGDSSESSIHHASWPEFDSALVVDDTVTIGVQINGKLRAEITVSKDIDEDTLRAQVLEITEVQKWIEGKEIKKFIYVSGKIISIVI